MKQEGPVVSPKPYLPPMVATVVGDLSKRILEEGSLATKSKGDCRGDGGLLHDVL